MGMILGGKKVSSCRKKKQYDYNGLSGRIFESEKATPVNFLLSTRKMIELIIETNIWLDRCIMVQDVWLKILNKKP